MQSAGRLLIIAGFILILIGIFFYLLDKMPFLGKLPGDIYIKKDNFHFYFPLTTCIILSIILSLIIFFFRSIR